MKNNTFLKKKMCKNIASTTLERAGIVLMFNYDGLTGVKARYKSRSHQPDEAHAYYSEYNVVNSINRSHTCVRIFCFFFFVFWAKSNFRRADCCPRHSEPYYINRIRGCIAKTHPNQHADTKSYRCTRVRSTQRIFACIHDDIMYFIL